MPTLPSLVRANIFQRKTRAAITILAVAIEVTAVLIIVGLTNGTINEVADRMQGVGADVVVRASGSSAIMGFADVAFPEALAGRIEAMEAVESASPVLAYTSEFGTGAPVTMWGIDPERFASIGGELEILEGEMLGDGFEMVVDRRLAAANGISVGQRVETLNSEWEVVGIFRPGVGGRLFVPLETLQELLGLEDRAHVIFVKTRTRSPEAIAAVAAGVEEDFPGYETTALEGYAQSIFESVTGLQQFNAAISSVAVILSFLVILLAMYTSIIERTREIGILKALGASKLYIMRAIMSESVLLCFLGALSGYALAYGSRWALLSTYETLVVEFTWDWIAYAGVLGLVGGLLGSFYPALRAARQDPVRALRYE